MESFVKTIYQQVKQWALLPYYEESTETNLSSQRRRRQAVLVLDDASTLAGLLGDRLAYGLILSLQALSRHSFGRLAIRACNDFDIERALLVDPRSKQWFGAGGGESNGSGSNEQQQQPWERRLVESVDTIIDVVPLASGYTREAHGRLVFTKQSANSSRSSSSSSQIYNYCLTDNQALAIRIAR